VAISIRRVLGTAFLAALVAPRPARALDPEKPLGAYTVDVWGARKGLPSSYVRAISQTADGYLWIAGYGGVGRYDGARIVTLPEPEPMGRIFDTQSFKVDHRGTLWLISSKGTPVCVRDAIASDCLPPGVELPPDTRLVDAHPDADGTAWLATRTGVLRYLPGPPRLVRIPAPDLGRLALIHRDRAGRLWLGGDNGLYRAQKDGAFVPIRRDDPLLSPQVRAYFETPQGRLWFLFDGGIVRVEGDDVRVFSEGRRYPRGAQVIEDRDGNLWIGSQRGLTRFREGRWTTFTSRDGLPDDDVTALHEDREGSLWVGTRSGGIAQFTDRVVETVPGPPLVRELSRVNSVCQDRTGAYWFASRVGLARWKGVEARLYTQRDGLPAEQVLVVAPGARGEIWAGTPRGLVRIENGRIEAPVATEDEVGALHLAEDGTLWMGLGERLARLRQGRLEEVARSTQGPVRNIEPDRGGQLWVASNRGVSRLEGGRLVPVDLGDRPGRALHRDRDGRLWLTAGMDIVRLSPGPIRVLGPSLGLGGRQLFQMIDDGRGWFWVGTSRGLARLPKARLLALADGQPGAIVPLSLETDDQRRDVIANNTRDPGVWQDSAGRLWFATEQGALTIDPARLRVNALPPPVRIDEATADAHALLRGARNDLAPGPGNLAFRFSAVTLLEPNKSLHRYRLEGFDAAWTEAGTRRVAYYTNIPPGSYRFHVQGSNADGIWNEEGDVVELRLRPHFYRTRLFYAACALGVLSALVLIWRQRVRGLRRGYLVALAERGRVARELHDTLLQGMSGVALKVRGLSRKLGADGAVARELAEIDTLVVSTLKETRQFLGDLRGQSAAGDLAVAIERLAGRLTESGDISCAVVVEGEAAALPDDVKGDLFRIAQEAINNAVKHAHPRRIDVKLRYQPDATVLTVADDGCGFEQSGAAGAAQGHFGLLGMRERAARLGDIRLTSHPGQGTTVEVTVPLEGSAHG
jgi:ligand-binding sensor domain-containing protein